MTAKLQSAPTRFAKPPATFPLHRVSVEQYHRFIDSGAFVSDNRIELLDGWLVTKMPQNPEHRVAMRRLSRIIEKAISSEWTVFVQLPITLDSSEPEPDIAIVRGPEEKYDGRHPYPADVGLIIEVANESLPRDRKEKSRIYAEAKIPEYWIANVKAGTVEVFAKPTNGKANRYRLAKTYKKADTSPLILDGKSIAEIPVREIFP